MSIALLPEWLRDTKLGQQMHQELLERKEAERAALYDEAAQQYRQLEQQQTQELGDIDERINAIAFESEKLAHGTPSGVDNTLATYAQPMLFRNDGGLHIELLRPAGVPPVVVAWGEEAGSTKEMVAGVRARHSAAPAHFDAIFDQMDRISMEGGRLLRDGDWQGLGALMNLCQGLLNGIGVSTPELERMIALARQSGAAGAKLTGAGGGGSIVALCPGTVDEVAGALRRSGYNTLVPGGVNRS